MSVAETITSRGEHLTTPRALQVLVAGVNVWFVGAGFPWLFLEEPTVMQSVAHGAPVVILLAGLSFLRWTQASAPLHSLSRTVLMVGVPLTVGLATALRSEETNHDALPAWALLLCVASMWVFVGLLSMTETARAQSTNATRPAPTTGRERWSTRWVPRITVFAALVTVTAAPHWTTTRERLDGSATEPAAGLLLTTAAAIAIAVGMLLIVMGPRGVAATVATGASLRQRLLPLFLTAIVGAATYAVTYALR